MVMPGWKTFLFFGIMAVVQAFRTYSGVEIPPDIADKLSQVEIDKLAGYGQYMFDWILIVGGFFFRAITSSPPLNK